MIAVTGPSIDNVPVSKIRAPVLPAKTLRMMAVSLWIIDKFELYTSVVDRDILLENLKVNGTVAEQVEFFDDFDEAEWKVTISSIRKDYKSKKSASVKNTRSTVIKKTAKPVATKSTKPVATKVTIPVSKKANWSDATSEDEDELVSETIHNTPQSNDDDSIVSDMANVSIDTSVKKTRKVSTKQTKSSNTTVDNSTSSSDDVSPVPVSDKKGVKPVKSKKVTIVEKLEEDETDIQTTVIIINGIEYLMDDDGVIYDKLTFDVMEGLHYSG
jgi:hypothetical protein